MPRVLGPRNDDLVRRISRGSGAVSLRDFSQLSVKRSSSPTQSSMTSLRRQKSSRQSALLEYLREDPASSQNAEWSPQCPAPAPSRPNALLNIVNQSPPAGAVCPAPVPPRPSSGAAHGSPQQRYSLHQVAFQGQRTTPAPGGAPADPGLRGARRHTFHRIDEESDVWGHFAETAEANEEHDRRVRGLAAFRRCAASVSHLNHG